jgi:dihydroxyacid dehydratase/phosphogluconate dehydratase
MGTATTMNSLAEALGMMLPGSAAIPAPYRDRRNAPITPASASSTWCAKTSSRRTF